MITYYKDITTQKNASKTFFTTNNSRNFNDWNETHGTNPLKFDLLLDTHSFENHVSYRLNDDTTKKYYPTRNFENAEILIINWVPNQEYSKILKCI